LATRLDSPAASPNCVAHVDLASRRQIERSLHCGRDLVRVEARTRIHGHTVGCLLRRELGLRAEVDGLSLESVEVRAHDTAERGDFIQRSFKRTERRYRRRPYANQRRRNGGRQTGPYARQ
jgi:hypothetical protein